MFEFFQKVFFLRKLKYLYIESHNLFFLIRFTINYLNILYYLHLCYITNHIYVFTELCEKYARILRKIILASLRGLYVPEVKRKL